jgi:hypothetical protein
MLAFEKTFLFAGILFLLVLPLLAFLKTADTTTGSTVDAHLEM